MAKANVIICDIDGTIVDIQHRLHYIKGPIEKKDIVRLKGIPNSKKNPGVVMDYSVCTTSAETTYKVSWLTGGFTHEPLDKVTKVPSYSKFFRAISEDIPIQTTIDIVETMTKRWNVPVVFCSGRPEHTRSRTAKQLNDNFDDEIRKYLFMRADQDYREDSVVKEEIYLRDIEPYYNPICVFDDRTRVVEMWRKHGLQTYQVAEGNF